MNSTAPAYEFYTVLLGDYKENPRLYSREMLDDAITFTDNDCGFYDEPKEIHTHVEHNWKAEGF